MSSSEKNIGRLDCDFYNSCAGGQGRESCEGERGGESKEGGDGSSRLRLGENCSTVDWVSFVKMTGCYHNYIHSDNTTLYKA